MRQILGTAAAAALLAACSGGDDVAGGDPATDPDPIDDVCALVTPEDASRIVGVRYVAADEPAPDALFALCSYEKATPEAPHTLIVSAGAGDLDDVARGLELAGEVTREPLDVPGAEAAAVLATDDGDVAVEQVAAEADGNVYVVTFGGSTEVAVRLLAAALGEDVADHPGDPVPDACALEPSAVERILAGPAAPTPGATEAAWSSCTFDSGAGTSASLSTARDAGDLDRYLVEHSYVPEGAGPEDLTLPGADEALLVAGPDAGGGAGVSTATALAVVGPVVYELEVTDVLGGDAATIARELLALAIGSS